MRSLKAQYFLTYAALGSLSPFMPVYLESRGLTRPQVGQVLATAGLAVLLTPLLVGFLADTHLDPRRLMGGLCVLAGGAAGALYWAAGFWPILFLYTLHCLAFVPFLSLEDGMNFSLQRHRLRQGQTVEPYHRVRVWGTIGWILPSVILYFLFRAGLPMGVILFSAAAFCAMGLCNTFRLPEGCRPRRIFAIDAPDPAESMEFAQPAEPPEPMVSTGPARLSEDFKPRLNGSLPNQKLEIRNQTFFQHPAFAAARAMLEPHLLVYCLGMFLLNMAAFAYYTFYPIYLTDQAHIGPEWVGLIASVGVVGEIFYMLNFGRLERLLGLKRLLGTGVAAIVLRMTLLGATGAWVVAIGTQLLHGLQVLTIQVMPPVYLDRHASDSNRNSMQGTYTMLVSGLGRTAGTLAAGYVAGKLATVFFGCAALASVAGGLFVLAFREKPTAVVEVAVGD